MTSGIKFNSAEQLHAFVKSTNLTKQCHKSQKQLNPLAIREKLVVSVKCECITEADS